MEALQNLWNVYKGDIVPALVTGLLIVMAAMFAYFASRIRALGYKKEAEAKIEAEEASLEETKEVERQAEIEAIHEEIKATKDCLFYLADLFNTAFQTSALPPEVKETLASLTAKVKNGVSEDRVAELESELIKYKELYESAEAKVKETVEKIADIQETRNTRVRR